VSKFICGASLYVNRERRSPGSRSYGARHPGRSATRPSQACTRAASPPGAESESEAKPQRKRKSKKSIIAGDIDLATLEGRANPSFVVTSLKADQHQARELYEKIYCARGEMENRIKECQLDLFADRTSTGTMRANQLRRWLSSMAYVLTSALRRIALASPVSPTPRISVRRIKLSMASAFPYTDVFRTAWAALDGAAR